MKTGLSRILRQIGTAASLALALASCQRETLPLPEQEGSIRPGTPVQFTTCLPGSPATRTATPEETAFNTRMGAYRAVSDDYQFTVEMYQEGVVDALGSAEYLPTKTILNEGLENESVSYASDGTLVAAGSSPLYWPGNARRYAFKATAGTPTLQEDQSSKESFLRQDRLEGYAFEPLWDETGNAPVDNENGLNYRTTKEWYAANQEALGLTLSSDDYKKIPLYLKHQRSLITVILKAGEGVNRNDLAYETAWSNIHTTIFYGGESAWVNPLAAATTVDYTSSDYGAAASDVPTTQYSAVVEPHNYLANATGDIIAQINLSGQRFTFYAGNDSQYAASLTSDPDAVEHMEHYNLTAGKHLVITATLGRGSRKILITAYVEDWTETVTTSIVDDFGQAGDPYQIYSRRDLYEFLRDDTKNKQGNVAIIMPPSLNLEMDGTTPTPWDYDLSLNCTLNMAGATFRTDHTVFSSIGQSGNLVNGSVTVGKDATVTAAIATENLGTLERVHVMPRDTLGNPSNGIASKAGLVVTNSGTIVGCSSELPVYGTSSGYVGGIAASSVYAPGASTMPVISGCRVNARVDGGVGVQGGGIVGEAVGRVADNTFEYGITLLQNADAVKFMNCIFTKAENTHTLRAYNNAWPTVTDDGYAENTNGTPSEERFDAVIDSQAELERLLDSSNNQSGKKYRLSNSFSVTGWTHGQDDDVKEINPGGTVNGNVAFNLDGNNLTITTDAMLFSNLISCEIKDLTICLSANLISATPDGFDAIAPLAYSVSGATARLSNIQVKAGNYRIQAATAGGVVAWAYGGATLEDCQCKASIQVWHPGLAAEARIFSGGIAACAAQATFTRCIFHSTDGTLFRNISEPYDAATSDPEPEPSLGMYYGGILGGTVAKGLNPTQEIPSVLITDCTSWLSTGTLYQGAIVGCAVYRDEGTSTLKNGLADGCQGNWWNTTSEGIALRVSGKTIDQLLGKRNAVTPMQDLTY